MRGKASFLSSGASSTRITPAYAGKSYLGFCSVWHNQDHPRLCGEKLSKNPSIQSTKGSPPPMRGKGRSLFRCIRQSGITPAYAGKSIQLLSYGQEDWDHPRLCGEKLSGTWSTTSAAGSPPPMRGKVLWSGCTPYASKDHPRLCGEKYGYYTIEVSSLGSPPPMRGKAALPACLHFFTRITPAYAGKREKRFSLPANIRDHPRLCGEKRQLESLLSSDRGSPPPMRGKAENACVTDEGNRITPAYAGKSVIVAFVFFKSWDHPRLCGEKFIRITPIKDTPGSPPPMRGKECYTNGSCAVHRITPAYAGKSRTTARAIFRQKDHPRLCGEKFVKCSRSFTLSGSPPPMRGKGYRCW